jgi:hypothetical protein
MKRLITFIIAVMVGVSLLGQGQSTTRDITIVKTAPTLFLKGAGAVLDFNTGDITLTQSSNQLLLGGGNLSLGANSLLGTGSIGLTGSRFTKIWLTDLESTNSPTVNGTPISSIYAPLSNPTLTGSVLVPTPTLAGQAANKSYVDGLIATGISWVAPVEDIVSTLANGIAINLRYILSTNNHIYYSNGDNTWTDLGVTTTGLACYVKADVAAPTNYVGQYNYNGAAWVYIGSLSAHSDLSGLQGGQVGQYYHLNNAEYVRQGQAATSVLNGYLTSTDWSTFNSKQSAITSGNLTESVTGLEFDQTRAVIGGSLALSLTSGYTIPTTTQVSNASTAYGWGNHASAGYITASGSITGSANSVKSNATTGIAQLTGMGTGTTRVYTVPDANATLLYNGGALGTPTSGSAANLTSFPTLNQSTTGTANIAGGTAGAIPYQSGANTTTVLAASTTANKMLLSNASAAPTWSTSTIPTSAGASARKALVSDGTDYKLSSATLPVSGDIVNKQIQKVANDSTLAAATDIADISEEITDNVIISVSDTTVTPALGRIVYKTSNNHFYGCISTTATSTPKWVRLDN